MRKIFIAVAFTVVLLSACKKEYCWTCTSTVTGNDEEACGMTKKEAERKESSGYTCTRK